jgi:hypothetical protein
MVNILTFPVTFNVNVIHDTEDGMWVASCDELYLSTEAISFEALVDRVWEVAPDCIEANGFDIDPQALRLHFAFEQSAATRKAN